MAIPNVITRQNIIEVINQIDNGRRIPPNRLARKIELRFNQTNYPVKILISWSHEVATGQELPYNSFITQEALRYLTDLGFEIISI